MPASDLSSIPPRIIETPRLILREFTPDDVAGLALMYADPETMRFIGPGGTIDLEGTRASIERTIARNAEQGFGLWAVDLKPVRRLVGRCGLILWDDIDGREEMEVAYLIARDQWGHGLATEAATAIRDHAFAELGRTRLISMMYPANAASAAVARKVGMSYEKDVELFGHRVLLYALERAPRSGPSDP